jgi:HlyD family secretion protein
MTATVKFLVGSASDALSVPNAALRFKPAIAAGASSGSTSVVRARVRNVSAGGAGVARPGGAARDSTMSTLWSFDSTTKALKPVRVHVGLSDGTRTQVIGNGLEEGMQIIVGANTGTTAPAAAASTNPLQPQTQSTGRRGGPPGGF